MADNITAKANTGSGVEVLAADDIGGVLYPRTKLVIGADGVNDGDVSSANPMPVVAGRLENLVALMARAVKLLESSAIVDSAQRQRIVVDAGTITTVTTVASVTALGTSAGMDREQYINIAKQTYASSIRSRLNFV
jgi:hypothetical protein